MGDQRAKKGSYRILRMHRCDALLSSTKNAPDRDDNNQMISPRWEIDQSFEYETGLTRSHQGNARKAAKKLGVLQERRSRNGGRLDYLLNLDLLAEIVSKWADEERNFQRSSAKNMVEETRQRLDSYDISEIDRKRRTAARDAVDMLSPSERGKLIKKFIDENIGGDATSFEPITGEFRKLDEKLHCKR
jgi:hypothetical protein